MVKTVVKPIFGGSKRCQEIENPTPHKFFSAVIIPYLEGIVKCLLSTCKICGAVVKEKALLTYLLITLKNHRKISVIVKCDYHATL